VEDLEEYLIKFADPTIADFEQNPSSVRYGFLACVVLFHAVDYRAYPKSSSGLRQQWRKKSDDFALIDKVAHAFKHVATPSPSRPKLLAKHVSRRPPAIVGQMMLGASLLGDPTGAVVVEGKNLLHVVRRAASFLREIVQAPSVQ
jgi:hypothetical protein